MKISPGVKGTNINRIVLETQRYYENIRKFDDFSRMRLKWSNFIENRLGWQEKKAKAGHLRLYTAEETCLCEYIDQC